MASVFIFFSFCPYPVRLQDLCRKHFAKKKKCSMHLKEKTLSYSIKKLLQQHFFEIRHLSRNGSSGTKKWCTNLVTLIMKSHLFGVQATATTPLPLLLWWLTRLCLLCGPIPAFFLCIFPPPTGLPQLWIIWDLAFSSSALPARRTQRSISSQFKTLFGRKSYDRKSQCTKISLKSLISFGFIFRFVCTSLRHIRKNILYTFWGGWHSPI